MIELVLRAARADAASPAVVTDERTTSYGELAGHAVGVATALRARGIRRLAVVDDEQAAVLAVLAGADLAGVEACVYPLAAPREAIDDMTARFEHTVLVSRRPSLRDHPAFLDTDELLTPEPVPADVELPPDRPLLILTTGTTGAPRAARHEWPRLTHRAVRLQRTPEQRWLLAYGLNQMGGMQVLLHVLGAGAPLVVPAALRPREGLAAMRRHGVTHASATPTFWRFVLAELTAGGAPAPDLRQITLGGEAVPAAVLEQLRTTFPAAHVSQIYAATEFGATATVRDGVAGLPASVLDGDGDVAVKIVDGELWVRSRASMLGYHGEPPVDPDAWRPTGDLVELAGDRILFRGRASDVVNVGGVKVHPGPIEERISHIPGVAVARVFGRPNPMVGAILAAEIVPTPGTDTDELDAVIREACADLPPAHRPRRITFVETVATTGGKISRGPATPERPATKE